MEDRDSTDRPRFPWALLCLVLWLSAATTVQAQGASNETRDFLDSLLAPCDREDLSAHTGRDALERYVDCTMHRLRPQIQAPRGHKEWNELLELRRTSSESLENAGCRHRTLALELGKALEKGPFGLNRPEFFSAQARSSLLLHSEAKKRRRDVLSFLLRQGKLPGDQAQWWDHIRRLEEAGAERAGIDDLTRFQREAERLGSDLATLEQRITGLPICTPRSAFKDAWLKAGTGDCTGEDVGDSPGSQPRSSQLTAARAYLRDTGRLMIAVCWDGQRFTNPKGPYGGKSAAWCTYKKLPNERPCTGGRYEGRIYKLGRSD